MRKNCRKQTIEVSLNFMPRRTNLWPFSKIVFFFKYFKIEIVIELQVFEWKSVFSEMFYKFELTKRWF